ncbi:MAG: TonB-dependent receptor [Bacteroidia bacterium]
MKRLIFLLSSLLLCSLLQAQSSISGTITGAAGEPLPGAFIRLMNTPFQTLSDNHGNFLINAAEGSDYAIQVRYIGFRDTMLYLKAPANGLKIQLSVLNHLSNEVVVTATRAGNNAGLAQSTINREDIEKLNTGQDLPYLLQLLPSAVMTSDAGNGVGYTGIRIRGSDASRVNVSVNGTPVNDAESQLVYWVNMPDFASSAEDIQVQRGAGTSVNGAGAFGGTINILTQDKNDTAYAQTTAGYGSFNTLRNNISFGTGSIRQHFFLEGRLSRITSDGYIDRATSDLKSFYMSGGYYDKNNLLRVNVFSGKEVTYQSWYGTPESRVNGNQQEMLDYSIRNGLSEEETANLLNSGRTYNYYTYENQVDNYQQDHYQLLYSRALPKNWVANVALHATKGRGYYEEYKKDQSLLAYGLLPVQLNDTTIDATDLVRRRWLDNWFYGATWSIKGDVSSKINLLWGGGWNKYDGDHFGEITWARYASTSETGDRYYFNTAEKTDFNTFVKAGLQTGRSTSVYADLQYRRVNYIFTGPDELGNPAPQEATLSFFNPKAGISHRIQNMEVYASAAVAQREPNRDDYTETTRKSRPRPEMMIDYEAGVKYANRKINAGINFYYMDYYDQLVLNGKINDVGSYTRVNIDRSYRMGAELEAAWMVARKVTVKGNLTLSDNRITEFIEYTDAYDVDFNYIGQQTDTFRNTIIAFSPAITSALQLSYTPFTSTEISLIARHVSEQFLDNTENNDRIIPAYTVTDVRLSFTPATKWCKNLRVDLLINNLFSTMYSSNGYTYGYLYDNSRIQEDFFYPQATINYMAQATLRF